MQPVPPVRFRPGTLAAPAVLAVLAAPGLGSAAPQDLELSYQRFELENGLDVVVHEDHSDPIVAVYVVYHVGSSREEPGRSGFAHLFEHMMFQGSANVGDDQHFKLVQEAGGTLNGTTNEDRTNYFEVLPSNQLELALWLEADRMGFLLPAVTQEKLDNQREVVKNERRQSYENRPYGMVSETIARALYPPDHPYSWTTIGSMEDLSAASLADVTGFFRRWYGPNNATLAIGGDVDPQQALALAEKYFGPIPRGPEVAEPEPRPVRLEGTRRLVIEDKVQLPQLTVVWPAVPMEHDDEAALDVLASVLAANQSAVLEKALTIDQQLASSVRSSNDSGELAGTFSVTLRPQPGVHLDVLERRMHEILDELGRTGVEEERMMRLRNRYEASFVRRLETVGGRTGRMASDNVFHNDPGYATKDLARHLAVTAEDVERVLAAYVLGRPAIVLSVVPEGRLDEAASGRAPEQLAQEAALERGSRPAAGPRPGFAPPAVWRSTLANGVEVVGTRFDELPLARLSLSIPAGRLHESMDRLGLASLTAEMLSEGTQRRTGVELTDAFDAIGATFGVGSDDDEITLSVSALEKHMPAAVALLEEVLLEPRFAPEDFERVRKERLTDLSVRADDIRAIAGDVWRALIYGTDGVAGMPQDGTPATVAGLTVEHVRDFWRAHARPRGARVVFVGARDAEGVGQLLGSLTARWKAAETAVEASFHEPQPRFPERTTVYLVDKPGAAQSEIRIGHPGVSSLDPRAYDLQLLNHPLGGSFSSRINLNLREDKGYTYGARSSFGGGLHVAPFTASAAVRTDVTGPAVAEMMKELSGIREGVTEEELAFLREGLAQSMTRQFESTGALSGFLEAISLYDYPEDYPAQRLARLETITLEELDELARSVLHPGRMAILVVGDRAAVLEQLRALPYGEIVELDPQGRPISG